VSIARYWPTPQGVMGIPPNPPGSGSDEVPCRSARVSPAFAAPYGVDDKTIESCKARFPYEPVGEGPVIPVEGVAHEPKGEK
jgi:hypothetical protein